jgi:hypothetical protein
LKDSSLFVLPDNLDLTVIVAVIAVRMMQMITD